MSIKKFNGEITKIVDFSKTAKEITISLDEPIDFLPGNFMNVFFDLNGEKVRRAYSISSSSKEYDSVSFLIRLSPKGLVTPLFWNTDMIGQKLSLMGPLGVNTVDKMTKKKVFLFAFGVGAGVIKSIADYFINIRNIDSLTIFTGSRTEDEILYKDYFSEIENSHDNISVKHIISNPSEGSIYSKGYIQDFIDSLNFDNSDVYVCGQEAACTSLCEKVKNMNPVDCTFFVEAFH